MYNKLVELRLVYSDIQAWFVQRKGGLPKCFWRHLWLMADLLAMLSAWNFVSPELDRWPVHTDKIFFEHWKIILQVPAAGRAHNNSTRIYSLTKPRNLTNHAYHQASINCASGATTVQTAFKKRQESMEEERGCFRGSRRSRRSKRWIDSRVSCHEI